MADEDNGADVRDDESDALPAPPAWKAPASAAELNDIIEKRLARERKRFADYDTLREKATRLDTLEQANATDLEKTAKAARDEGRTEALREVTPRLVRTAFKAEAKGVLSSDQLNTLLEDLDLSRYVTEGGEVDEDRIAKKIKALAPQRDEDEPRPRFPDLGGGKRGGVSTATDMNARLRQMAAERNR